MIKLGISTAWNAKTAPDAISMISEIKTLGFDRVELNFTLTSRDICDIISVKGSSGIEIISVHNYCPVPEGVDPKNASPDYYSLSSVDEGERKKAVAATKTTIECAEKLGAQAVILHLGKVDVKDRTRELAATVDDRANFERVKKKAFEERAARCAAHFDKTISSVKELLGFAQKRRIRLGLENRYYYNEIPSIGELDLLLSRFESPYIGYWHDVGHAQLFQNIGLFEHKGDFLDRFSSRMIGVHLHDIAGTDDHRAPLEGNFDFTLLKPYLKKDMLLVLEPHRSAAPEKIKMGARYLAGLYGDIR